MPRLSDRIEGLHQEVTGLLNEVRNVHLPDIVNAANDDAGDIEARVTRIKIGAKRAEGLLEEVVRKIADADLSIRQEE